MFENILGLGDFFPLLIQNSAFRMTVLHYLNAEDNLGSSTCPLSK
jgi:hypothetical protein